MPGPVAATELAFQSYGPAGGPPLLLVHGFPLDSAMWRLQTYPLSNLGIRLIVPDLRGFGKTPLPDGADALEPASRGIDAMAEDLVQLLDRLKLGRASVAGFSMGGYVALALAHRHPERLEQLVLIDTKADGDTEEGRTKRLALRDRVLAEGIAPVADAMLSGMLTPRTHAHQPRLVEEVQAMMYRQGGEAPRRGLLPGRSARDVRGVAAAMLAMAHRPDRSGMLAHLKARTTVLVGAEDHVTPPAASQAMASAIPGARLEVIPDGAHLTPLECPAAVTMALGKLFT